MRDRQLLFQIVPFEIIIKLLISCLRDRDADPSRLKNPKSLGHNQLGDSSEQIDRDDRLLRPPNGTTFQDRTLFAMAPSPKSVKMRHGLREQNERNNLGCVLNRTL